MSATAPDECRAAVRYQLKFGADVIKFMPSGGVLSLSDPVDVPELTQEEMNAIVSEAHAWKRKVAAHCHGDRAAKMAIAAGVDSIEHGSFLEDDTLQEMKKQHVYLVPTLFAGYWVGQQADKFPPVIAEKARAAAARIQQMFQHAVRIGVPIAMGTDAGGRAARHERARVLADDGQRPEPRPGADGGHRQRRRPARNRRSNRDVAAGEGCRYCGRDR